MFNPKPGLDSRAFPRVHHSVLCGQQPGFLTLHNSDKPCIEHEEAPWLGHDPVSECEWYEELQEAGSERIAYEAEIPREGAAQT